MLVSAAFIIVLGFRHAVFERAVNSRHASNWLVRSLFEKTFPLSLKTF